VVIGELSKLGTADEREEGVQLVKEVAASIAEGVEISPFNKASSYPPSPQLDPAQ